VRAGKAIVSVVVILNLVSSIGTDGSFGNQDSDKSLLSEIGRTLTPVFHPMGLTDENWPATVGIFTGIFAKEVVVGTLDALYSPVSTPVNESLAEQLRSAVASIPANLIALGDTLLDPLGVRVEEYSDLNQAAEDQAVALTTIGALQTYFDGRLGAFAYLLFILLYMPCVATIGVIFKEIGGFWAIFSTSWSLILAYTCAVLSYQLGGLATGATAAAGAALGWSALVVGLSVGCFALLVYFGRHRAPPLIPLLRLD